MSKTKDQLDELQVRHEQLEMMMEWQKGLRNLQTEVIDSLVNHWDELTYPYVTNDEERTELTKLSRKYTLLEIMNAMDISSEQYIKYDAQKDEPTEDSVLNAFKKLAGILRNRKDFEKDPELSELYYIRGILKNRFSAYPVETFSMKLMDEARKKGVSIREMRELAKTQSTWTKFKDSVEELMSEKSARVETTI